MTVFGIATGAEIRTGSGSLTAARQGWRTVTAVYEGDPSRSIRRTLADVGEPAALCLEGEIGSQPGYVAGCSPDEEQQS